MLQNGKAIAPLALLQAPSWPPATEGGFSGDIYTPGPERPAGFRRSLTGGAVPMPLGAAIGVCGGEASFFDDITTSLGFVGVFHFNRIVWI